MSGGALCSKITSKKLEMKKLLKKLTMWATSSSNELPRRHVACVARLQLEVQALHQLILGSGGDNLHASGGDCPERRGATCCWAAPWKPDWEEARLLAGLPEVLLPVRSVKCWG